MESIEVEMVVNGHTRSAFVEPRKTLADYLRDDLGLTGTHLGCEHGVCGSCTVLLDGTAVRACLLFAVQARGSHVTTVEGLTGPDDTLHDIQQVFSDHHALQCGFCTPGFLMTVAEILGEERLDPSDMSVRRRLSGNLCRCTGYQNIVAAVSHLIEHEMRRRSGEADPVGR